MAVASVGNLNFDIYVRAPELPGPDQSVEALEVYTGGGGSAANFAVAARRLGLQVRFVGAVGDDPLGQLALRELEAEGVDVRLVKRVPGARSGIVVVLVHPDGGKRMLAFRGANLALSPDDITAERLAGVRHIHLATGRPELIEAAKEAAASLGATVSVDGGTALARRGLAAVRRALEGVHVAFMNAAEASALAGGRPEDLAGQLPVEELVITLGPQGALAFVDGRAHHVGALQVEAVDSTGAGDCFAAAYVAARLRGLDVRRRLLFANAAAAIKVSRRGARSSPTAAEVLELLASLGHKLIY